MRTLALLLVAAGLLLGAVGCGGGDDNGGGSDTTAAPATTAPSGSGDAAAGKEVFASAGCGGCHTFSAAGSNGSVGPNLDDASPSFDKGRSDAAFLRKASISSASRDGHHL